MFTPPEAEAREASATKGDPNGKRNHVSAEPQKRTLEVVDQYAHAEPLPVPGRSVELDDDSHALLTDYCRRHHLDARTFVSALVIAEVHSGGRTYGGGVADGMRAFRDSAALQLERRAQDITLGAVKYTPTDVDTDNAIAGELFSWASRFRGAVAK